MRRRSVLPGHRGVLRPPPTVVLIGPDADDAAEAACLLPAALRCRRSIGPRRSLRGPLAPDTGNSQRLEVSSPSPALLYVADAWYPLLRARVDGRPAPLYRANYAFRAVPLPAGASSVEFYYHPIDLYAGIAATALGLLGLIAAILFLARRRASSLPLDASR